MKHAMPTIGEWFADGPFVSPPTSQEAVQVSSHGYVLNSIVGSSEPMTSPAQSNCSSSSTQKTAPKDTGLIMSDIPGTTLGWRFQVAEAGCRGAPLSSMFADLGFSVGQVPVASSLSVQMAYLTIFHIGMMEKSTALKVVGFIKGLESGGAAWLLIGSRRASFWEIPEARGLEGQLSTCTMVTLACSKHSRSSRPGSLPASHNSQMSGDRVVNLNTISNTQETCHETLGCCR